MSLGSAIARVPPTVPLTLQFRIRPVCGQWANSRHVASWPKGAAGWCGDRCPRACGFRGLNAATLVAVDDHCKPCAVCFCEVGELQGEVCGRASDEARGTADRRGVMIRKQLDGELRSLFESGAAFDERPGLADVGRDGFNRRRFAMVANRVVDADGCHQLDALRCSMFWDLDAIGHDELEFSLVVGRDGDAA